MGTLNKIIAVSKLKNFEKRKQRHDEAQALVDERKIFQAVKLFRENLDWSLANFGQDHATTVYDQETLAYAVSELGHQNQTKNRVKQDEKAKKSIKALFEEARDLDEKALETRTRVEGTSPPSKDLLVTQTNLANDYVSLENYRKAAGLFLNNYEARRTHPDFGEDHDLTLRAGHDLAGCWHKQGNFEKAKALNQKILDARIRLNKPEADIGKSRNALHWNCQMLDERKKRREAEKKAAQDDKSPGQDAPKGRGVGGKNGPDGGKPAPLNSNFPDSTANENGRGSGSDGNQNPSPAAIQPIQIPAITYKYVDPRASGIGQAGSETSSRSSSPSNNVNIPFRRGSGQSSRPSTPNIIDANPDQQRSKPRPNSWIQGSPGLNPTNNSAPSDNLKPTDNTSSKKAEVGRSRSVSDKGRGDKSKVPPRARSNSPPAIELKHYRQLSDAGPGKNDEASTREVNSWFYSLTAETQALLDPLRRARGKRVKIAILDTGIDIGHPYFAADQAAEPRSRRIKSCEDFLDPKGTGQDVCGHGTHCVGLLRKVTPEADIYVARVAKDFDAELNPEIVAKAILKACRDGKDENGKKNWNVDIITMSFGFYGLSHVVRKAIQEALAKPVLVFAAASNNGTQRKVTFPAWLGGVICVNSATGYGSPSLFNPEVVAPMNFSILGENIKSAWIRSPDNPKAEKVMSGTSMATPILAGVAALVLEFVLQNDPESVLIEQLEDLKHPDGMPEVFALMIGGHGKYRNLVPWELLSAKKGTTVEKSRIIVSSLIENALRKFRGE